MVQPPQEGGRTDPRSLTDLKLESFSLEVTEWTDGQVNVSLTISTQAARYRVPMPLSGFLTLAIEVNQVLVEILKRRKVGK